MMGRTRASLIIQKSEDGVLWRISDAALYASKARNSYLDLSVDPVFSKTGPGGNAALLIFYPFHGDPCPHANRLFFVQDKVYRCKSVKECITPSAPPSL